MSDVVLLDYGIGNLHSLGKALGRHGRPVRIERDVARVADAGILVLPGVGAFGAAAAALAPGLGRLREAIDTGLPCLGICLGMHLLFERSEEGPGAGIGLLAGRVRRLDAPRIPHMGWNTVDSGTDRLFEGLRGMVGYYANSYVVEADEPADVIAWTRYADERFPAAVRRGRVWGVQFHPEKSGASGLRVLDNFMQLACA